MTKMELIDEFIHNKYRWPPNVFQSRYKDIHSSQIRRSPLFKYDGPMPWTMHPERLVHSYHALAVSVKRRSIYNFLWLMKKWHWLMTSKIPWSIESKLRWFRSLEASMEWLSMVFQTDNERGPVTHGSVMQRIQMSKGQSVQSLECRLLRLSLIHI